MKIARIKFEDKVYLSRIEDTSAFIIAEESHHPRADVFIESVTAGIDWLSDKWEVPLNSVKLLAPLVRPGKIVAIGQNYLDHAHESGAEAPEFPIAFDKAITSIIGDGDTISYRRDQSVQVDYEAELAVVIGRRARNVPESDANDYLFGYTVCNDVSARDAQFADGQWFRGKSFDTFAPLGPWIVTRDSVENAQDLQIRSWINCQLLQDGNTEEMIFGIAKIISYLSHSMTLEPGDIITTGTPVGVGFARVPPIFLEDGDLVTVEVSQIGRLENRVKVDANIDEVEKESDVGVLRGTV